MRVVLWNKRSTSSNVLRAVSCLRVCSAEPRLAAEEQRNREQRA